MHKRFRFIFDSSILHEKNEAGHLKNGPGKSIETVTLIFTRFPLNFYLCASFGLLSPGDISNFPFLSFFINHLCMTCVIIPLEALHISQFPTPASRGHLWLKSQPRGRSKYVHPSKKRLRKYRHFFILFQDTDRSTGGAFSGRTPVEMFHRHFPHVPLTLIIIVFDSQGTTHYIPDTLRDEPSINHHCDTCT